ncbi:MAG: DnaJ domain-containing protein [Bacteroidales bacterium]|nr:DnaJ domain-containing protein [Bacteroidales bacterium]
MGKYGKWITGGLGWAIFGPIGGILGFAIGSIFDSAEISTKVYTGESSRNGFIVSLLVLVSAVMKADGKVFKSELDFVKKYFYDNFGADAAREAMILLRDILKQQVPLKDVCTQIRDNVDYSSRLQLIHLLFGVAYADGIVSKAEQDVISDISGFLGISSQDFESIKAMFVVNINSYYTILEVEPTSTNEEIKKAYRSMAIKHHPDKVGYLGEDLRKNAEQKFKKINEAYEKIKKERGFN